MFVLCVYFQCLWGFKGYFNIDICLKWDLPDWFMINACNRISLCHYDCIKCCKYYKFQLSVQIIK